jgi:hypothetical protein
MTLTGQHTPGPWKLGHSSLHGANGEPVMMARDFLQLSPADRALVVAAPDLLAACEAEGGPELLDQAADWIGGHSRGTANALRAMAEAMRAAIAKAKGEPEVRR